MTKLVCETKKTRVLSVQLVWDTQSNLNSAQYSIEEIGQLKDKSYLDAEGQSSPIEILLNFESDTDGNALNIPVFLKKQVEEYDRFKLKIYFNDNSINTWAFSWPDRSEDGIFELPLQEVLEELDVPDPETAPSEPEPPAPYEPEPPAPYEPEPPAPYEPEPPAPSEPEPPGHTDTKPLDPADPETKKRTKVLLPILCLILVSFGISMLWFYEYFVPNKEFACFETEILKKASYDEEIAKSHNSKCLKRFLALSESDFKTQLLTWTKEDTSLIIEAGDFHSPNILTSFLKKLRPSDKPDTISAAWYYSKAYSLNIEEAAEKLQDLCQKTEDLYEKTIIETDCDLVANE